MRWLRPWERMKYGAIGVAPSLRLSSITPNAGAPIGGTSVTITGHGFYNQTDGTPPIVLFGEDPATSVVVVNGSTLTCLTPAGVGTVDITVIVGVLSAFLYSAYFYIQPAIISVDPVFGPITGGTRVLLTGINFQDLSVITFGGVPATGFVFIDQQHVSCLTPVVDDAQFADVIITLPDNDTARLPHGFQFTTLTRGFDIRRTPGIAISQQLNAQPYTATVVFDGRTNVPTIGERVSITDSADGDRLLYSGSVQDVVTGFTDENEYESDIQHLQYTAKLVDDTDLLNSIYPIENYVGVSVTAIIQDLYPKYAPTFDCVSYVQTKLAAISITFDGTKGLFDCTVALAQALGGGHCSIDALDKLHFFHIAPASIPGVQGPQTLNTEPTMVIGSPLSALNVTSIYGAGVYGFLWTEEDANGHESALSNISDVQFLDGAHRLDFTFPVGSASAVIRHCYVMRMVNVPTAIPGGDGVNTVVEIYNALGNYATAIRFATIQDNLTTTFSAYFIGDVIDIAGITDANVTVPDDAKTIPIPAIVRPQGPPTAPTTTLTIVTGPDWWMGERLATRVAFLYRNGTVSFYGPPSSDAVQQLIQGQGVTGFVVSQIPVGPTINGVPCIARIIIAGYPAYGGSVDNFYNSPIGWGSTAGNAYVLPNNTDDTLVAKFASATESAAGDLVIIDYYVSLLAQLVNSGFGVNNPAYYADSLVASEPTPIWPNPDGPNPEDTLPSPVDVTDADMVYLIRDAPPDHEIDGSQLRNRVTVAGAGSVLMSDAAAGATVLSIADVTAFSINGGTVLINGKFKISYNTPQLLNANNNGTIQLNSALPEAVLNGAPVVNFYQADNLESQRLLAKVEKDANGNPTNGVHAYPISDPSLKAFFQLYMRANAELELFSMPIETFKYATRDPLTRIGATVHVDLSYPPVYGDFLIQEVDIDQIHDESDTLSPRYQVTATSVRYSLDDLLLALVNGAYGGSSSPSNGLTGISATVLSTATSVANGFQQITYQAINFKGMFTTPLVLVAGVSGYALVPITLTLIALKSAGTAYTNGGTSFGLYYTGQPTVVIQASALGLDNTALNHEYDMRSPSVNSNNVQSSTLTGKSLELRTAADISGLGAAAVVTVSLLYMRVPWSAW